ncbi:MAG: hypothetical protein IPG88_14005 [Gemmatimonadetes bacterium]|nr:hypothetical protein [Gemmatimonadota bacterium]
MSQKAVGKTADVLASYYRKGVLDDTNHIDMESRIQARSLQAMLLAWEMQAPGGGYYTPATWATHLPLMLTQIFKAQKPTGAFLWNGYCGTSINYMNGLLNDVMIRYYQRFQADAASLRRSRPTRTGCGPTSGGQRARASTISQRTVLGTTRDLAPRST